MRSTFFQCSIDYGFKATDVEKDNITYMYTSTGPIAYTKLIKKYIKTEKRQQIVNYQKG